MSIPASRPDETDAERTARHVAVCKRLAELGMMLTRAAAAQATQALANPPSEGDPDAPSLEAVTRFTRLAAGVRRAITLECRIAAGDTAFAPDTQADPRRAPIRLALRHATRASADRACLREEADEMLDEELAQDPDGFTPPEDILAAICEDLDIGMDWEHAADLSAQSAGQLTPSGDAAQPDWRPARRSHPRNGA